MSITCLCMFMYAWFHQLQLLPASSCRALCTDLVCFADIYIYIYMCVCVCIYIHIYTYICIYIYIPGPAYCFLNIRNCLQSVIRRTNQHEFDQQLADSDKGLFKTCKTLCSFSFSIRCWNKYPVTVTVTVTVCPQRTRIVVGVTISLF